MLFDDLTLEEVRALDRRDTLEEGIGIGQERERERIFDRLIAYGMTRQEALEIVNA